MKYPLILGFIVIAVFGCKNNDPEPTMDPSTETPEEIIDTSAIVKEIRDLLQYGINHNCDSAISIDSAENLWNKSKENHPLGYQYIPHSNEYFDWAYAVVRFREIKNDSGRRSITISSYDIWSYSESTLLVTSSSIDKDFNECRELKRRADSLGIPLEYSVTKDGLICSCQFTEPDPALNDCADCDPYSGFSYDAFKWIEE